MWRASEHGVVLCGSRCAQCGLSVFPARTFCRRCFAATMQPVDLPRRGVLYAWTVVHKAPPAFRTPYVLGYVDLPGGVRVLAQIEADLADLRTDLPVQLQIGAVSRAADGSDVPGVRFAAVAA